MESNSYFANQIHAYELQRRSRKEKADISVTPVFPGLVNSSIQTTDRDGEKVLEAATCQTL